MSAHAECIVGILDDKLNIEVKQCPWDKPRQHSVLVSRNGYQWTGFALASVEELVGVRDTINAYLKEYKE